MPSTHMGIAVQPPAAMIDDPVTQHGSATHPGSNR